MADKEGKPNVDAKKLIATFEKGEVAQVDGVKGGETPLAKPGITKKLQHVYEGISKPEPSPSISKGPPRKVNPGVIKPSGPKNVLIVYAHYNKKSFNGALLASAMKSLKQEGHNVTVSDLYAMKWNPSLSLEDTGESKNNESTNFLEGIFQAVNDGSIAKDIAEEHRKIREADIIIFQFPLQWFSFPAILKGWFDRCLSNGFAFNTEKGQLFDQGLMKGKKAILSFTTGGTSAAYSNKGIDGDINVLLWPMQYGTLRFSGFDVLAPQISYNVMHCDDKTRKGYLTSWEERLKTIDHERPLKFVSLENFSISNGLVLTEESPVMKKVKDGQGITIGQNLGKAFPPNSMTGSE